MLLTARYFPLVIEAYAEASAARQLETVNRYRATLYVQQRPHWLDYDPVALAMLVIGIGIIELLALII